MASDQRKSSVTVRIGGEDHIIRANVEPEYTRRCAEWVDDRISEIKGQLGLIESHKAAILAALSITDELFQAQGEAKALRKETARRAGTLARRLELALADEEPVQGGQGEPERDGT
jgi:cell division protein ZapA